MDSDRLAREATCVSDPGLALTYCTAQPPGPRGRDVGGGWGGAAAAGKVVRVAGPGDTVGTHPRRSGFCCLKEAERVFGYCLSTMGTDVALLRGLISTPRACHTMFLKGARAQGSLGTCIKAWSLTTGAGSRVRGRRQTWGTRKGARCLDTGPE